MIGGFYFAHSFMVIIVKRKWQTVQWKAMETMLKINNIF
jgi:hypothetical protein